MANILVTGGAGFLGQYLVQALAEAGHAVRVLDLRQPENALVNLGKLCCKVTFGVDITKPSDLRDHFQGLDLVYHLAGLVSFWRKDAQRLRNVNVLGSSNVLRESAVSGVRRFVHVSSVAAIGYAGNGRDAVDETHVFDWSKVGHKHYMLSKHQAELAVLDACKSGLDAVIVNPGLMWGPGDMLNSFKLIQGIASGRVPACPPGGTNIVDVRDVARGLVLFAKQGQSGQRYILGGHNLSFREVYDTIGQVLDVPAPRRTLPGWSRPVLYALVLLHELCRSRAPQVTADNIESSFRYRYFSSEKALRELGWRAAIPFPQTIRDAVQWLREHSKLVIP